MVTDSGLEKKKGDGPDNHHPLDVLRQVAGWSKNHPAILEDKAASNIWQGSK